MTNLKVKNILDLASGEKAPMDGRTDKAGFSRVVENSVFDKIYHLGHQGGATRRASPAVTHINHFEAIW